MDRGSIVSFGRTALLTVPMPNTNCLEGIACPVCHSKEPFLIEMTATIQIWDDGTEAHGDTTWEDTSPITCCECGHEGVVKDFTICPKGG